jgi:hypothetical protein
MHDALNAIEPSQTNALIRELLDFEITIVAGGEIKEFQFTPIEAHAP